MSHQQVFAVAEGPNLVLTQELLEQLGVKPGAQVGITIEDRTITLRALDEAEQDRLIDEAMEELIESRRDLYRRLAEGPQ